MKVWVIGSEGLVGKDVTLELNKRGISSIRSSHKEADIVDVQSLDFFYEKHKPTHIINCAADVDVDGAEGAYKQRSHEVNVEGVINLANLAQKAGLPVVHVSTDYVFDGESELDYKETDETNPINEYGKTKLEGEENLLKICKKATSVRTASLYGFGKMGLIAGIVKALQEKEEVRHISDQISSPTYTKDLAGALIDVLELPGIYHFTNSGSTSRLGLVEEVKRVCEEMGMVLRCKKVVGVTRLESNRPAMRPKRSVLSCEKIKPYLTTPLRSWQEALRDYLFTMKEKEILL